MANQVFDGYDHYNQDVDFFARSGFLQYQQASASAVGVAFVTGLIGTGKALQLTSGTFSKGLLCVYAARNQEAFVGWRVEFPVDQSSGAASGGWWVFTDSVGALPQISVWFNKANYTVQVFRGGLTGGTSLGLSANNVWTNSNSQFIEFDVKVASSGGIVNVKVNGVSVLNLTGQNTQVTANAWWDSIAVYPDPYQGGSQNSYIWLDDHYYNDTTSGPGVTPLNSFLGDATVKTLFATGNDSVQFTPLANANWQEISEQAMDSDGSYNYSGTATNQDTLGFQALTGTIDKVYGIQLTYAVRKDDGSARTMKSVVKIGGTSYFGTTYAFGTSYSYLTDLFILNPATGLNWSVSDVNGAVYGYNLVT